MVVNFWDGCLNKSFLRISFYGTASTDESVLILGGRISQKSPAFTTTIAEYKNGSWKNIGNLVQARQHHSSITSGSITMTVGGNPNSGSS